MVAENELLRCCFLFSSASTSSLPHNLLACLARGSCLAFSFPLPSPLFSLSPLPHTGGWFPAQRVSRLQALRGFTLDAAFAARLEQDLGSLEVGKLADFAVLDRDILDEFAVSEEKILNTTVLQTFLAGRKVYDSSDGVAAAGGMSPSPQWKGQPLPVMPREFVKEDGEDDGRRRRRQR